MVFPEKHAFTQETYHYHSMIELFLVKCFYNIQVMEFSHLGEERL